MEVWLRKRRQYICENTHNTLSFNDPDYMCRQADDDLRNAKCSNKNNQSVIEIMKTEIECGWSSSSRISGFTIIVTIFSIFVVGIA